MKKVNFSNYYENFLKNYYRTHNFTEAKRIVNVLEQIDTIYNKIRTHKEYDTKLEEKRINFFDKEANRHSVLLEEGIQKYTSKEKKILYSNLFNAGNLLKNKGINKTTISMLGNIIDPISNPYQTFRNSLVKFGDFYPPSNLENILVGLDYFFYIVDDKKLHPILRSNEAHIELVKIHPYNDGNGRIARLVQNRILKQHKYPPLLINIKERNLYIQLMEKALERRYNENTTFSSLSSEEVSLYLFFTTKVLDSISKIKIDLDKRRIYDLMIKTKRESDIYSLIKQLRKRNLTINYNKKNKLENGCNLEIIGDIKKRKLEILINNAFKYRKNFSYYFNDRCN